MIPIPDRDAQQRKRIETMWTQSFPAKNGFFAMLLNALLKFASIGLLLCGLVLSLLISMLQILAKGNLNLIFSLDEIRERSEKNKK